MRRSKTTWIVAVAAVLAGPVTAQAEGPSTTLECPKGTRQVGGKDSVLEAVACSKSTGVPGRVFHGPYVTFHKNGQKAAEGQYLDGFRHGLWVFHDEAGRKVGQTEFLKGDYHGRRVEYFSDGRIKLEETWKAGKREGVVRSWNSSGAMSSTEYRNDRPVGAGK